MSIKRMKDKLPVVVAFAAISLSIACGGEKQEPAPGTNSKDTITAPSPNPYANAKVEVKTFKTDNGWGYDVWIMGAPSIHQAHIPGISGLQAFKTEQGANKTGELVAYKIRNNIMPPAISLAELDSLGVLK